MQQKSVSSLGLFNFGVVYLTAGLKESKKKKCQDKLKVWNKAKKNYSEERVQKGFQDGCIAKTFLKATLIRKSTH